MKELGEGCSLSAQVGAGENWDAETFGSWKGFQEGADGWGSILEICGQKTRGGVSGIQAIAGCKYRETSNRIRNLCEDAGRGTLGKGMGEGPRL